MRRSALFNNEVLGMNIVNWCSRLAMLLQLRCFFSVELWINEQPLFGVQDEIPNRRPGYCNIISKVQIWSNLLLIAISLKRNLSWNIAIPTNSNVQKDWWAMLSWKKPELFYILPCRCTTITFLNDADNADNTLCTNTYILIVSSHNQYQINIFTIS